MLPGFVSAARPLDRVELYERLEMIQAYADPNPDLKVIKVIGWNVGG